MLDIREDKHGFVFKIRVQPRASKNQLAGLLGDSLRIRLSAPPVDGEANKACQEFIAQCLGIPRSQVELVAGHTGRNKLVRVTGLTRDVILQRLKML